MAQQASRATKRLLQHVAFSNWTEANFELLVVSVLKKPQALLKGQSPVLQSLFQQSFLPRAEELRPDFKANSSQFVLMDSARNDLGFLRLYALNLLQQRQLLGVEEDECWMQILQDVGCLDDDDETLTPEQKATVEQQLFPEIQNMVGTLLAELDPSAEAVLRLMTIAIMEGFHVLYPVSRISEVPEIRTSLGPDQRPCSFYLIRPQYSQNNKNNSDDYLLLWSSITGKQTSHRAGSSALDDRTPVAQNVLTGHHEFLLRTQLDFVKILQNALWSCKVNRPIFSADICYLFPSTPAWEGLSQLRAHHLSEAVFRAHLAADISKFSMAQGLPALNASDLRKFIRQRAAGNNAEFSGFNGLSGPRAKICARIMNSEAVLKLLDTNNDSFPAEELPDQEIQELAAMMLEHHAFDPSSLAVGAIGRKFMAQQCNSRLADGHYQPPTPVAGLDLIHSSLSKDFEFFFGSSFRAHFFNLFQPLKKRNLSSNQPNLLQRLRLRRPEMSRAWSNTRQTLLTYP